MLFPRVLSGPYCMTDQSLLPRTNTIRTVCSRYAKTNVLRLTDNRAELNISSVRRIRHEYIGTQKKLGVFI